MDVAAIIVNYRTASAAIEAARSLDADLAAYEHVIYIVDNDSRDGSVSALRAAFGEGTGSGAIEVIDTGHNGGYGFGINVAVRAAGLLPHAPRYFYILNPDAQADPGSVQKLITFLDAHPEAGVVGSLVHDPAGEIQARAFRFPSVWSELEGTAHWGPLTALLRKHQVALDPDETTEVDWVPGTSMLVRREVFSTAGLFDEGFFLYFEEVDFARRVKKAGWKVYYLAGAGITHIGSLATGMTDASRRMPRYWFQARRRYFVKHHGRLYGALSDAAWLSGHALFIAKQRVRRRRAFVRPRLWRDFAKYSLGHAFSPPPLAEQNLRLPAPAIDGQEAPALPDGRDAVDVPLRELWREDWATHEHDLGSPGFWAVAVHRLAQAAGQPQRSPVRRGLMKAAHAGLSQAVNWLWGINLPASVSVGRRVRLSEDGAMFLHAKSIGDDVHIRQDTTFGPTSGQSEASQSLPTIQDKADIGPGVCVLGAVRVGRGATIGAHSVVLDHVPESATAQGVPAQVLPSGPAR